MITDIQTQKITDVKKKILTDSGLYKDLTYKIIGALYEVHKELGSVHKEIIYHKALAAELDNSIFHLLKKHP